MSGNYDQWELNPEQSGQSGQSEWGKSVPGDGDAAVRASAWR